MSPLIHNQTHLPLQPGKSLFDYADDLAVRVPTSCNRTGECHECIVEVRQGLDALSPLTDAENFLRDNYRLACQATVVDIEADIEFNILRRQPRILTESIARDDIELDPLTVREGNNIIFKGEPAPFANSSAPFAKRKGARASAAMRAGDAPSPFRESKGARKSEAIFAGDARQGPRVVDRYRGRILGIAADIGTTTVAMNLVDLETGDILYTASFENPQRFGGSDVMNRISYDTGTYRGELQAVLISSINYEIGEMVRALKIRRRHIVEFVAVGNTTMRDILFGIDVEPVGQKPYKSHIETDFTDGKRDTTAINALAHELGIRINPNANIYSGPLISSHIGSDIAADLLTIAIDQQTDPIILIDIGTNTEIIAGNRHQLHAASCPAGPAFEGGQVTYAMPGYNGAVEHVVIPPLSQGERGASERSDASGVCPGPGGDESPLPRNLPSPSQGEIKRGYRVRVTGPGSAPETPLPQTENNPVGAGFKPAPTTQETLETSRHPDAASETPLSQSENNPVGAGFKPAPTTPEDHALSRHPGGCCGNAPFAKRKGARCEASGGCPPPLHHRQHHPHRHLRLRTHRPPSRTPTTRHHERTRKLQRRLRRIHIPPRKPTHPLPSRHLSPRPSQSRQLLRTKHRPRNHQNNPRRLHPPLPSRRLRQLHQHPKRHRHRLHPQHPTRPHNQNRQRLPPRRNHHAHQRHKTRHHRNPSHHHHPHRTRNQPQLLRPLRRRLPV